MPLAGIPSGLKIIASQLNTERTCAARSVIPTKGNSSIEGFDGNRQKYGVIRRYLVEAGSPYVGPE
jgi:hypothetical protein